MPRVEANGVSIEYEPFGEKGNTPLVLIAGNGAQMLFWESKFCEMLADAGFFVVRFDKRDSGLSDKFDALGVPDMGDFYRAAAEGREIAPPRSLSDMADDVAGLLDGLGIGRSFVCGASMGERLPSCSLSGIPSAPRPWSPSYLPTRIRGIRRSTLARWTP